MPTDGEPTRARRLRTDAQRNRARLLETAKSAFAEKGSGVSLDEIARGAGVGIGTLYRHFPTRDALVEAVYRNETEQLAEAAKTLSASTTPVEALREWMLLFVDYLETKQGMSEALNSIVGGTSDLYAASTTQMKQAMGLLVDRAAGEMHLDIDPLDLLRAIAGVATISSGPDWKQAAKRLVDIMISGLLAESSPGRNRAGQGHPGGRRLGRK